jgi:hypothetical protein
VNTNRVTAFKGDELVISEWIKLFGHYLNLLFVDASLKFLAWYQLHSGRRIEFSAEQFELLSESLHLPHSNSFAHLVSSLRKAQVNFEAYINNVCSAERPPLSLQGAPLDLLFSFLAEVSDFSNKSFCFLIDEYENYEDYQQQVVNTLIKHSGQLYTFKVGVKELGWRRRSTLNENEQLISPADYAWINIADRLQGVQFEKFALDVCKSRLSKLETGGANNLDPQEILPGLSEDAEAERLGIDKALEQIEHRDPDEWRKIFSEDRFRTLPKLLVLFLFSWADTQKSSPSTVFDEYASNPRDGDIRFGNYKYALLFAIRTGKVGLRKYYCGWNTFTQLAAGNIRYLLELLDQSLLMWLRSSCSLSDPISPEVQTQAAQYVGKKNLSELEGLSVHGAQLTKLLLGLGRVFQVMAGVPMGHAPEVNQFQLEDGNSNRNAEVEELLGAAVMHLALLRFPGNKPIDESDTREYNFMVHPIFAAFFAFSARRKRKMNISGADLLGLVHDPKQSIQKILKRQNRNDDSPLPEQARLFGAYYGKS